MTKSRAFTLRLQPELSKRLRIEAINRGTSTQQLLISMIERGLEPKP